MIPKYNDFLAKVMEFSVSEMPEELSKAAEIIKKDWKKILKNKEPEELKKINEKYDIKFMKYKEKNRCQVRDYEKEDVESAAKLDYALKTWHENIITLENSSDILPFLYFFPDLYWNGDQVVESASKYFGIDAVPKISSHLFEILMSNKVDRIQSNNYRDKKIIELYYSGISKKRLRDTFDFFSSIEGGCGLHSCIDRGRGAPFSDLLSFSSKIILSHVDLDKYINLLNDKDKSPFEIYILILSLNCDQKIVLLSEKYSQLNNPFSIIFLIKLFLYDVWNETELKDDLIEKISLGYSRLFEIDDDYGFQSIVEFTRYIGNKHIFKIVGALLGKLNNEQFQEYVKNEKFEDYDGFTDYYFELLKFLEKYASDQRFFFYLTESYKKWLEALNKYGADKKYAFNLIVNSHTSIACKYLSILEKDKLENIIIEAKEGIKSLASNRWMASLSEAITLFFVSFTKLYYSISAIRERGYKLEDSLKTEINNLLNNKWITMRYCLMNEDSFSKQVEKIRL